LNKISFRSAVRLVHPDTNPSITDAGTKMRTVMYHKKDEVALYRLMSYWNLLKTQTTPKPTPTPKPKMFKLEPNTLYNGTISVGIFGIGMIFVDKTTKNRVYFTKSEKQRTGKTWTSFNKVLCVKKEI